MQVRKSEIKVDLGSYLDKMPPQSSDAEKSVIGSMLIDPRVIPDVARVLGGPEAFFYQVNQAVFQGLVQLGDKHGQADVMLLAQQLTDAGQFESVGGAEYLAECANIVPTAVNAIHYANIVAEKARLRRLVNAAGEILHEVYDNAQATGDAADAIIDAAEQRVFEISAYRRNTASMAESMGDLARAELTELMEREGSPAPIGLCTGFQAIDAKLLPLSPGQLILIAARPSMGKTSLALNLAENIALGRRQLSFGEQGDGRAPVGFFSLEMSKKELIGRFIASAARVPMERYINANLSRGEWQLVHSAANQVQDMPMFIDDTPSISIGQLRTRARRLVAKHGLRLLVVDHLGLMTVGSDKRGDRNRNDEVSQISRGLKGIAKELGIPVIALCQLNRDVERRDGNRPRMSDLRDSGSLEQDADTIIMLHREAYYHRGESEWDPEDPNFNHLNTDKLTEADAFLVKQRNGPTGTIKLEFIEAETRFKDREPKGGTRAY